MDSNNLPHINIYQKTCIWLKTTLLLLGLILITLITYCSYYGLPSLFRRVELSELETKTDLIGEALLNLKDTDDILIGRIKEIQASQKLAKR